MTRRKRLSRRSLLALVLGALGVRPLSARADRPYSFTATIVAAEHEVGGRGVGWVELRFDDGTSISVGGDMDLPMMGWLASRRGLTVSGALS